MEALSRHERIVLQFSGGKDSLACLMLLRPWWDRILVAWANRGAEFPETFEIMDWVRSLGVHFVQLDPPVPHEEAMRRFGYPADIIPLRHLPAAAELTSQPVPGVRLQPYLDCCNRQFWQPMDEFVRRIGATLVIRGQRLAEEMKSPVRSGDVLDGIEYLFPIESWTESQVLDYLQEQGVSLPAHYQHTSKSLDCWACTAYLHESKDQLEYTRRFHPDKWAIVRARLEAIQQAVRAEARFLDAALED